MFDGTEVTDTSVHRHTKFRELKIARPVHIAPVGCLCNYYGWRFRVVNANVTWYSAVLVEVLSCDIARNVHDDQIALAD